MQEIILKFFYHGQDMKSGNMQALQYLMYFNANSGDVKNTESQSLIIKMAVYNSYSFLMA